MLDTLVDQNGIAYVDNNNVAYECYIDLQQLTDEDGLSYTDQSGVEYLMYSPADIEDKTLESALVFNINPQGDITKEMQLESELLTNNEIIASLTREQPNESVLSYTINLSSDITRDKLLNSELDAILTDENGNPYTDELGNNYNTSISSMLTKFSSNSDITKDKVLESLLTIVTQIEADIQHHVTNEAILNINFNFDFDDIKYKELESILQTQIVSEVTITRERQLESSIEYKVNISGVIFKAAGYWNKIVAKF